MHQSEPFPHLVDDYLAYLYEVLPSQAGLDGVHIHDDLLDDLSKQAIESHVRALAGFARRLQQIDVRFGKRLTLGRMKIRGQFDIYNLFNANNVLSQNAAYGASWQAPSSVLGARLFKFGNQRILFGAYPVLFLEFALHEQGHT